MHTCHSTHVEVREQNVGVSSFLPPCQPRKSDSGKLGGCCLYPSNHLAGPHGLHVTGALFGVTSWKSQLLYTHEELLSMKVILVHHVSSLGRNYMEQQEDSGHHEWTPWQDVMMSCCDISHSPLPSHPNAFFVIHLLGSSSVLPASAFLLLYLFLLLFHFSFFFSINYFLFLWHFQLCWLVCSL